MKSTYILSKVVPANKFYSSTHFSYYLYLFVLYCYTLGSNCSGRILHAYVKSLNNIKAYQPSYKTET